jgi:hypothetical protein
MRTKAQSESPVLDGLVSQSLGLFHQDATLNDQRAIDRCVPNHENCVWQRMPRVSSHTSLVRRGEMRFS